MLMLSNANLQASVQPVAIELRAQLAQYFGTASRLANRLHLVPFAHYEPTAKEVLKLCYSNAIRFDLVLPPEEQLPRLENFLETLQRPALAHFLVECGESRLRELAAMGESTMKFIHFTEAGTLALTPS